MRKAYIILAHNKPEQLGRLVNSLDDGRSEFFLHIDRASDKYPFRRALSRYCAWRFVKSEDGSWGQLGIVNATLNGLREIAKSGWTFDVVNLLSGQDYPLRSNRYIEHFFELNHSKIFMEFFPIPTENWSDQGLDRIRAYHVGDRRRRSRKKASRWLTTFGNASILFRRRFPRGLKPFGGPQWWSIPMIAVDEILSFVERRPDYRRYHRWSMLPDEMFFQTILANSPSKEIAKNLVNNCLRFVDWHHPNPSAPATLTREYFDSMINSKALFARKFDASVDPTILDQLDEYRATEDNRLQGQSAVGAAATDFARSADYPDTPASWSRPTFVGPP